MLHVVAEIAGRPSNSVIRTLAERYNAESRRCIEQGLEAVEDAQGLQAAYSQLLLIWHLGEATMRLAVTCTPEEGRALVEAFKRMSLREVMEPACRDI
ncbi:hypothetical protein BOO88_16360 [Stutzerimonas stutzeri]|nr:hypothetical protein BOO89_02540 [Stutzerimonas stutzeri]AZO90416.1 hypothetical protein BOO88_16360 [Stutzerimonas stutzeri]